MPSTKINSKGYTPLKEQCNECATKFMVNWMMYDDLRDEYLKNNPGVSKDETIIKLASLSSFEISGDYAKLFIALDSEDEKYFEKVLKLSKKFKTGFITLFKDEMEKDSVEENIRQYYDKLQVIEAKRKRDTKDRKEKMFFQLRIDSLDKAMQDSIDEHNRTLEQKRLEGFRSMSKIFIDTLDYSDSLQCYWYVHPNKGEHGMQCILPVANIAKGNHVLKIERKWYWKKEDSVTKEKRDTFWIEGYYFPFIKQ
ncbi:MAG: hypothetical protein IT268_11420 [Saprospiraceae bacterium]|nr:hypothetical protein [Saprospiraceae bacterium]